MNLFEGQRKMPNIGYGNSSRSRFCEKNGLKRFVLHNLKVSSSQAKLSIQMFQS